VLHQLDSEHPVALPGCDCTLPTARVLQHCGSRHQLLRPQVALRFVCSINYRIHLEGGDVGEREGYPIHRLCNFELGPTGDEREAIEKCCQENAPKRDAEEIPLGEEDVAEQQYQAKGEKKA